MLPIVASSPQKATASRPRGVRLLTRAGVLLCAVVAMAVGSLTPSVARAQETGSRNTAERVRIAFPRDDGTLTPYTFQLGYPLVTLVYDTLLWRGAGPWLARTLHRSEAGRRVTIRLREGIRWHDGRPLTARDVAFTFRYFAARFHPRFTPQLRAVERVEAVDRQTVAFTLRHRSPGFNDQPLSDVPILPRHEWEGLPSGAIAPPGLPVGSGPYRLVEHRSGRRYRFRANRRYFLGRPRVETLDVPFIADFDRAVRALEARRIDMVPVTLPESTQDRLRKASFKTSFGTLFTGVTLMLNVRRPPFDRPAVRRAIASALDLQRIARNEIIGGRDAVPADRGYLHPASGWTTPGAVYRFDPQRARAAFRRLDLPPIRVMAPDNDPVRREAGRQVVLALQRAGAAAALQELSGERLAAAVGQDGSPPRFQAAVWGSPALASHEPDFLRVVFGSRRAPLNYSGYRSAEFDRLAARAAAESNPTERRRLVKSELDLIARDAPVIPLFFQEGAFVFRHRIYDGWVYARGTGILDKRSFLPRVTRPARRPAGAAVPPASSSSDGGIGVLGFIALGLLGGVAVIAALGLVGRRRRR